MNNEFSFPLFGPGGHCNPGLYTMRKDALFDGGWRWYNSDVEAVTTINNVGTHPRAYADIQHL